MKQSHKKLTITQTENSSEKKKHINLHAHPYQNFEHSEITVDMFLPEDICSTMKRIVVKVPSFKSILINANLIDALDDIIDSESEDNEIIETRKRSAASLKYFLEKSDSDYDE